MRRATIPALVARFSARLRFPRLFVLTTLVFIGDLFVPDLIPFADEILLGLGTGLLGSWRRGRAERKLAGSDTTSGEEKRPEELPQN